jgi:hypothetical protein
MPFFTLSSASRVLARIDGASYPEASRFASANDE